MALLLAGMGELDLLARTIWGEARGESLKGMAAVCHVILNRVNDRRWPDSIAGVILQPFQFSMWNTTDKNRRQAIETNEGDQSYLRSLSIAAGALSGVVADPTGGALYYYNPKVVKKEPEWVKNVKQTAQIGEHLFFR